MSLHVESQSVLRLFFWQFFTGYLLAALMQRNPAQGSGDYFWRQRFVGGVLW